MAAVELRGVAKIYPGGIEAAGATDLAIDDGELLVVRRAVGVGQEHAAPADRRAGDAERRESLDRGRRADGLAPRRAIVALVFQNPAVYPHLSVRDNLAFGLRARGHAAAEIRERVAEVAGQLGLSGLLDRRAGDAFRRRAPARGAGAGARPAAARVPASTSRSPASTPLSAPRSAKS